MNDRLSLTKRCFGNAFDLALFGALFVAPIFMGGRGPLGKFIFVAFVAFMSAAWSVTILLHRRGRIVLSGAEWILVGGVVLLFLQLLPLSQSLLLALSPDLSDILPLWFASDEPNHFQIGSWQTLSLTPLATRHSLAMFLAYSIYFFLIVQRVRTIEDAEWLIRSLGYGAVALAIVGLAQLLFGNGNFLWVYEHPFRSAGHTVKAVFQNQNHFAHMMALGVGPQLWLLMRVLRHSKDGECKGASSMFVCEKSWAIEVLLVAVSLTLISLAVLLTFSRGGVLAFAVAVIVALGLYRFQGYWHHGVSKLAIGISAVVGLALSFHGFDALSRRLATLSASRSLDELSAARAALWNAMLDAAQDFWVAGTGFGSHTDVYPTYLKGYYGVEFTHGESGYLGLLMEGGVGAIFLLAGAVVFVALCFVKTMRLAVGNSIANGTRVVTLIPPIAAAIAASMFHSVADFVWYITACMSWTIVFLAVLSRMPSLLEDSGPEVSRLRSNDLRSTLSIRSRWLAKWYPSTVDLCPQRKVVVVVGMCACVTFAVLTLYRPALGSICWNEYRIVSRQIDIEDSDRLSKEVALLCKTIDCDPSHLAARLNLASHYLQEPEGQVGSSDRSAQAL